MALRMRIFDREPIGAALRRFKRLLERSGLRKEMRKRSHYQKLCEVWQAAKQRKQSVIRKGKMACQNEAPPWSIGLTTRFTGCSFLAVSKKIFGSDDRSYE
jgi:small subunit ribosomal protein S21